MLRRLGVEPAAAVREAAERAASRGQASVYLLTPKDAVAAFAVADAVRPESRSGRRAHGPETAIALFNYRYVGAARNFFTRWYAWAIRSRLLPITRVDRTLKERLENVLTYLKHPITNAGSESLNAKIQWVKYTGFRNKENFINAIYFHCGGLDLAPRP